MEKEAALSFRDQFRQARVFALRDAEAFDEIIFVVERMGMFMTRTVGTLAKYKYGSSTFSEGDLFNLPSLASKLKQPADAVSEYLRGELSKATLKTLANYEDTNHDPSPFQTALVKDLNKIIRGPCIYHDAQRFAGVVLSLETQQLLTQDPGGLSLRRLNRLLLQDAYPLELSRKDKPAIATEAKRSSLAYEVPARYGQLHIPFSELYDLVEDGRNWAMHQGAFARHLTDHATKLAIVLEDALMNGNNKVRDFMVQNPVCAEMWHPLSFIRQRMLESSFSFLPVNVAKEDHPPACRLISDIEVARYLRVNERNARLLQRLDKASGDIRAGEPNSIRPIQLDKPHFCQPDDSVHEALEDCDGLPVLVTRKETGELLGIVTAFDLL